jgi:hypothetical protein
MTKKLAAEPSERLRKANVSEVVQPLAQGPNTANPGVATAASAPPVPTAQDAQPAGTSAPVDAPAPVATEEATTSDETAFATLMEPQTVSESHKHAPLAAGDEATALASSEPPAVPPIKTVMT